MSTVHKIPLAERQAEMRQRMSKKSSVSSVSVGQRIAVSDSTTPPESQPNDERAPQFRRGEPHTRPNSKRDVPRCEKCHKPLSRYNPGPLCYACDYERLPEHGKELLDLCAELDRGRAENYYERWEGHGYAKAVSA